MDIQIISEPLHLTIAGFGGAAPNKDYAGTAFALSGRMWKVVKAKSISNKGQNVWVYGQADHVFAGVELIDPADAAKAGLEQLQLNLEQYAYYKHVGPYNLLRQVGQNMIQEITRRGLQTTLPHVEIYGHWTPDESKLETELLMSVR